MIKKAGRSRGFQLGLGLLLILAGLGLAWQTLAQAQDEAQTYSVRGEISDQQMFGKTLSTNRILPVASVLNAVGLQTSQAGSGPVVPARLRIPKLGIDTNVEQVEVLANGAMDVPTNVWNAGWLHTSPRPGDVGNAVLDGHKDTVRGAAIFWSLNQLAVGDRIYVSDIGGYELTFEVQAVNSYPLTDAPLDHIFGPGADNAHLLTLITCDGKFNQEAATYTNRLVVTAHQVN